jgi:hypothetical protein
MLERAKDMSKNGKDLVFVLDTARIRGWALAKVETKGDAGETIQVDKLLGAYDLK